MKLTLEWLALEEKLGERPSMSGTLAEFRTGFDKLGKIIEEKENTPADPSVHTRDGVTPDGLTFRIYTPREAHEKGERVPIGVYAHAGGLLCGSLEHYFDDRLCRYLAQHAPCILVSIEYRLAPEHPAPTQLEDYVRGYDWVWENAASLGGAREAVFAIGTSCGGGLALGAALRHLERGTMAERVRGVVALAPSTLHPRHAPAGLEAHLRSWRENREAPILNFDGLLLVSELNGTAALRDNPDVFPGVHERLGELPRTYIATCGADVVRDDGTIVKIAMDRAGVPCKLENYEGLPHLFWIYPEISESPVFRKNAAAAVKWVFQQ